MTEALFSIGIGTILIIIHMLVVICLTRFLSNISPITIHALSAMFVLIILFSLSLSNLTFNVWIAFSLLTFGVSGYLFVFCAFYKSLSLRMLSTIKLKGGHSSLSELDALVTEISFAERAEILCSMDLAVKENEGYRISKKGIYFAKKINRFQILFRITTRGLYQESP